MAISQDASTPGANTGTVASGTLTVTTPASGSFSPPAGSLLVAIVSIGHGNPAPSLVISDTGSHTWTTGPTVTGTQTTAVIYWTYLAAGATGIRVSVANSTSEGQGILLDVRVLTGAASSQAGAGHNTNTGTSTSWTGSLTTTQVNSWVMVAVAGDADETATPNGNTSTLNSYLQPGEDTLLSGEQATPTVTPGATTFGWTQGSSIAYSWAALGILPAAAAAAVAAPGRNLAVRAQFPPPRRGACRAIRFYPAPVSLSAGPVFRPARQPARIRPVLPRRGRISSGSPGAPVQNPPPPPPPGIPGINPGPTWLAQFKPQWPRPRPPAPPAIGVPPVFAVGNIALAAPLGFSGPAVNAGLTFLFLGPGAVYYLDYEDLLTQEVLHCVPGTSYSMFVASGRAAGLLDPPRDGRWLGYPASGFMVVFGAAREPAYAVMLHKGRAHNSARLARLARGEKPAPDEQPGLPEITCEGRIRIPPLGVHGG